MLDLDNIEPAAYYRLCRKAEEAGVPVSLDHPDTPRTVAELADRLVEARQQGWRARSGMGPFPLRDEILAEVLA